MKKGKRTIFILIFTTPVFILFFLKAISEGVQLAVIGIYGFVIACAFGKWALHQYVKSRWFRKEFLEYEDKDSDKLDSDSK